MIQSLDRVAFSAHIMYKTQHALFFVFTTDVSLGALVLGLVLVGLSVLGLRRCKGFPPVAASRGYSLVAVSGLLLMVASDVVEYGLWGCRLQKLQLPGSRAQTR